MIPNHCQKFDAELDVAQGLTVTASTERRGRDLYGQVSGRVTGQVGGAAEPEQPAASTGRLTSMEGCIEAPPKKGEINLKAGRVTLMCITEKALVRSMGSTQTSTIAGSNPRTEPPDPAALPYTTMFLNWVSS